MKFTALCFALMATLCGCAAQTVSMRTLPAESPAADNAAAVESAAAFAAAANEAMVEMQDGKSEVRLPPVTPQDAPSLITFDPWEHLNRFTYRFNARFDEAIFLPAANLYRRVPSPLRVGVHNFFSNLSEIKSVINYALQGRLPYGARSLGRFAINSTVGLGGLFDVAAKINMPLAATGFATTLAKWGMHPGPYLVMPLLGPSTARDGVGFLADFATMYAINVANLYRGTVSWALDPLYAVDRRANVDFRYYASGSPFEYESVRFLYVRKRLIEDEGLRAKSPTKGTKSTTQQENELHAPAGK